MVDWKRNYEKLQAEKLETQALLAGFKIHNARLQEAIRWVINDYDQTLIAGGINPRDWMDRLKAALPDWCDLNYIRQEDIDRMYPDERT